MTTAPRTIDLNADLGEATGPEALAHDAALLDIVTSASIACTGHAGDDESMRATAVVAIAKGRALGAHPSYPDRAGFGRLPMAIEPPALEAEIHRQIAALGHIVRSLGAELTHIKPHGALYHAAADSAPIARAIGAAAQRWNPDLILVGPCAAPCLELWRSMGLRVHAEAFADRAYEPDGRLRSRSLPGALITDPQRAALQAVSIARDQRTIALDGSRVPLNADTLCIHGDTPSALAIARAIAEALCDAGITPAAPMHG